jgi:hypothetical protein
MKINILVRSNQNFSKLANATVQDVGRSLYMVAEEIMTDAKANYVPVVTGNLRRSGFVEKPDIKGNSVNVTFGFGGAATEYALAVHEYPAGYGQGKNKFLSKPVNAAAPNIPNRMVVFMKRMTLGKAKP